MGRIDLGRDPRILGRLDETDGLADEEVDERHVEDFRIDEEGEPLRERLEPGRLQRLGQDGEIEDFLRVQRGVKPEKGSSKKIPIAL